MNSYIRDIQRSACLALLLANTTGLAVAADLMARSTPSADGVPISYAVGGEGGPTLVFIHGWSCDRGYWSEQLPYFSRAHRVIAVDLAGHGASGTERDGYSMARFAADVVAAAAGEDPLILIGHSMGGAVALEAARLLGERVRGVIAVDTLHNTGRPIPDAVAIDARLAPLQEDFLRQARSFIEGMFVEGTDPEWRERIVVDMLSADRDIAVSSVRGLLRANYRALLKDLRTPLVVINSTHWSTDMAAVQEQHADSRFLTMDGVGHFLMMEAPARFNSLLASAIVSIVADGRSVLSVTGFSGPEAVRYDPEQDVYFVANFNAAVSGDANGFVSKVSPEGHILEREFMRGTKEYPFHAGRGMYIDDGDLWVVDATGIHRFDRVTGEHRQFVDLSPFEPGFPNDIVKASDGKLYVTDTGKSVLYRVADGRVSIATDTPFAANGVTVNPENGRLVLAPWRGGDELLEWDPRSGEYSTLAPLIGGGNYDGVEAFGKTFVVASQADQRLHVIVAGEDRESVPVPGRPADLGVDTNRGRIIVPYVALDRIDIIDWVE